MTKRNNLVRIYIVVFAFLLCFVIFSSYSLSNHTKFVESNSSLLTKIDNKFYVNKLWNNVINGNTSKYYSSLNFACNNSLVFTANRWGLIQALDINTGKIIWSINLSTCTRFLSRNCSALLSGGIVIDNNKIYIGSELAKIYALDINNGKIIWQSKIAGEVLSSPTVYNGNILIYTNNGILQSVDDFDGINKWIISLGTTNYFTPTLRGISSPIIGFGTAVVCSKDGLISAVSIKEGNLIWQKRIFKRHDINKIDYFYDVKITPIIINNVKLMCAVSYNNNFVALDLNSGEIIWSKKTDLIANLLIENNKLYLLDRNDRIIAIDSRNGNILWRQNNLFNCGLTAPLLYKGYIIAGDLKGYLHWIKVEDGHYVTKRKLNNKGFFGNPVVINDKLIIQSKDAKINAFIFH